MTTETSTRGGAGGWISIPRVVPYLAAGAVVLRLLLLLGRGHYVAFDEGWYLLLGRNLWSGSGYTLTGLEHVALSPLFPILAGAVDRILGDAVWAGRLVAAVSSGLLVVPCWFIFQRLADPRVAGVAGLFVAVAPSLAPFVAPYWIGWDLWVGAEPLLHFFLFSGFALFLRAWEDRRPGSAVGCGIAFALAYLARPEAIVALGTLGAVAVGFVAVGSRLSSGSAPSAFYLVPRIGACALTFALVASPYWVYLHDSLGSWTITGRAVQVSPHTLTPAVVGREASPNRIETMLWQGDSSPYIRTLYGLNASGRALANGYWGVRPAEVDTAYAGSEDTMDSESAPNRERSDVGPPGAGPMDPAGSVGSASMEDEVSGASLGQASADLEPAPTTPWLLRYARALGVAFPWYLWLLVIPGLAAPGKDRRVDLEALVGTPLAVTSVLIARVVAIDPRTQLFIAPLAAFYAARGLLVVADAVKPTLAHRIRGEVVTGLFIGAVVLDLLGTSAVRLAMSLSVGSPHHVVAAENAAVGAAIQDATSVDATVMSFHPALALFADRDWRVLPLEPLDRIIRYARTQPNPYLVLSVFYPPEVRPLEEPHYLIVPVSADLPESDRWRIDIRERGSVMAFGELVPLE